MEVKTVNELSKTAVSRGDFSGSRLIALHRGREIAVKNEGLKKEEKLWFFGATSKRVQRTAEQNTARKLGVISKSKDWSCAQDINYERLRLLFGVRTFFYLPNPS